MESIPNKMINLHSVFSTVQLLTIQNKHSSTKSSLQETIHSSVVQCCLELLQYHLLHVSADYRHNSQVFGSQLLKWTWQTCTCLA